MRLFNQQLQLTITKKLNEPLFALLDLEDSELAKGVD